MKRDSVSAYVHMRRYTPYPFTELYGAEQYGNLYQEDKNKNRKYGLERYKNLSEDEK